MYIVILTVASFQSMLIVFCLFQGVEVGPGHGHPV